MHGLILVLSLHQNGGHTILMLKISSTTTFLSQIKMYHYIISISSLVGNTDQYFCTYLVILVGSLKRKDNCTSSPSLVRLMTK